MRRLLCLIPAAIVVTACYDSAEPLGPEPEFAPAVSEILLWSFVKIDVIDMGEGTANAINDAGVATGRYDGPNGPEVFTWTKAGGMQFPGVPGIAHDINNNGDIVGRSGAHAFLRWSYGPMSDLGTLAGGDSSAAFALNEDRLVAGTSDAPLLPHGFRWSHPGPMYDLHLFNYTVHESSRAYGINGSGHIVGEARYTYWTDAFIWTPTNGIALLPGAGGSETKAFDINDAGIVVGTSTVATQGTPFGPNFAVKWTPAGIQPLSGPGLTNTALAINNNNYAVGVTDQTDATLWAPSAAPYALGNLPGGGGSRAHDVNQHLEIVGSGRAADYTRHAVYWKVTFYYEVIGRLIPILRPELPPYIRLGETGLLEIAVLSDRRFDASQLDPSKFTLGDLRGDDLPVARDGKNRPLSSRVDVDDDGDVDLVVRFDQLALERSGELTAETTRLIVSADVGAGNGIYAPIAVQVIVR